MPMSPGSSTIVSAVERSGRTRGRRIRARLPRAKSTVTPASKTGEEAQAPNGIAQRPGEPRNERRERRLVDVAPRQVLRAVYEVQLVAIVAEAMAEGEVRATVRSARTYALGESFTRRWRLWGPREKSWLDADADDARFDDRAEDEARVPPGSAEERNRECEVGREEGARWHDEREKPEGIGLDERRSEAAQRSRRRRCPPRPTRARPAAVRVRRWRVRCPPRASHDAEHDERPACRRVRAQR